jgi:hypothetical protein
LISDFKSADANGDGRLSQTEFRQACDKGRAGAVTAQPEETYFTGALGGMTVAADWQSSNDPQAFP